MKKIIKILAAASALCATFTLAACGETPNNRINTSATWNSRITTGDLYENCYWLNHKETAEYDLSFVKGTNNAYSLSYDTDGTKEAYFKTSFYATQYNWNDEKVPEKYRKEVTDYVYCFESELKVSVTVTHTSSGKSKTYDNHITSKAYFRSADNNLYPVYTYREGANIVPAALNPQTIDACYVTIDCVYENFYNRDRSSVTVNYTDRTGAEAKTTTNTVSLNTTYSLFSNEYLPVAFRSFAANSGTYTFDLFETADRATASYNVKSERIGNLNKEDDVQLKIINALNNSQPSDYIFTGKTEEDVLYPVSRAILARNTEMAGPASSYWYAGVTDAEFNSARAVLLRVEETKPYYLGRLDFTLKAINCVEI